MIVTWKTLLTVVLLAAVLGIALLYARQTGMGRSDKRLRVVMLEGSPYNRGWIHGTSLRNEIHEVVELWKAGIEKKTGMNAAAFIQSFLEKTNFVPAIERWTPDLLEELRGIADSSGIDFNTVLMFQLPDEQWANQDDVIAESCTSIGVNRQGSTPTYIAQNLDVTHPYFHRYKILLHIKHDDSELESLVFTIPGLIAQNGMSSRSLAITCNTLSQLQYSTDGLPVSFIVRGVLQQRTLKDAVQFIESIKHASGQFYIVGGPERAFGFECSANSVVQYAPYDGADRNYHANEALVNSDFSPRYLERLKKSGRTVQEGTHYCYRFESLETRLRDASQTIDFDVIKSTLGSRDSEKEPISNKWTQACTIMELSDDPKLYVATGPPDTASLKTFSFSNLSRGGEE